MTLTGWACLLSQRILTIVNNAQHRIMTVDIENIFLKFQDTCTGCAGLCTGKRAVVVCGTYQPTSPKY